MGESFCIKVIVDVSVKKLFNAWLDSGEHTKFTGDDAVINPDEGGNFTAWDGYISGKTIKIKENSNIVQKWRTTDFPKNAEDSILDLKFKSVGKYTELTICHSNIPEGDSEKYKKGWYDYYIIPMTEYWFKCA